MRKLNIYYFQWLLMIILLLVIVLGIKGEEKEEGGD
jgi:hypothetical protein